MVELNDVKSDRGKRITNQVRKVGQRGGTSSEL